VVWFWRGLKGHSVTFAALFASLVLGASISGGVRHLLAALGVHWLYIVILPALLFGWMAKREGQWIPDERKRRRIARTLLIGSLVLAALIAWLRPAPKNADEAPRTEQTTRPAQPPRP